MTAPERVKPTGVEEAALALATADGAGRSVRFVGGGTKLGWGTAAPGVDVELSTAGLDRLLQHYAADLTAVLEAGLPLSAAQATFARAGQMLAVDPPDGEGRATIGGIVATGDSGPLRHRYGGIRDLLLGIRIVLPDGTVARAGGTVIKNVAGYDLSKLYAGSFGTLGLIAEVAVRLHPLPARRATALGRSGDPAALQATVLALGSAALELESLDVRWERGAGTLLARVAGVAPQERSARAADLMAGAGLKVEVESEDAGLWEAQRTAQRSEVDAVVKVSAVPSELGRILDQARRMGAAVVGRAGLGLFWVRLPQDEDASLARAIGELRASLHPRPCVVQDAPEAVRAAVDVWGTVPAVDLMRRVKDQFDPNRTCRPGAFVGRI